MVLAPSPRLIRAAALALVVATAFAFAFAFETPGARAEEATPDLSYIIVGGVGVPDPLVAIAADAGRGAALFQDAGAGGCAACHAVAVGESGGGPNLADVAARLSTSAIRLWIINPRALKDDATMPAYYTLSAEAAKREGAGDSGLLTEPPLTAEEIEHLVAYLETLK